jgi:hypothetical protein
MYGLAGGWLGLFHALLPGITYVSIYSTSHSLRIALATAFTLTTVLTVIRWRSGLSLGPALVSLIPTGVGIGVTLSTGRAIDAYLPGIVSSACFVLGASLSILIRVPLAGLVFSLAAGRAIRDWRSDRKELHLFQWITALFALASLLRVVVQGWLYLRDDFVALGIARLVMGVPLYVLSTLISWFLWRSNQRSRLAVSQDTDSG